MSAFWCILNIFFVSLCASAVRGSNVPEQQQTDNEVIVSTNLGRIRGSIMESRLGQDFYAFRGIRYGKPPIGDLRFKNPEPVDRWTDVYDATDDGPMCPQPTTNLSDVSEDCLRLNVYTRELPSRSKPNIRKPVIVYLHPGGFYFVSGQSKNFAGPQLFMDRDIVFVTLNYRLGSLGFLATGTADAPGNAGLKDQVLALRWIKKHIHRFGGDPDSVTLVGYSAGAVSITMHMVSPMSRGLFHKAIAMSGSATAQWEIPDRQMDLAERQARYFECPTDSPAAIVKCLKTKSAVVFGQSLGSMFEFGGGFPILLWKPVIEQDFGQERFLIEDPTISFQKGEFMKIPLIAGISKDEFVGPAINILRDRNLTQQLDTNFQTLAPLCFQYERNSENSRRISRRLRHHFLGNESLSLEKSINGLGYLISDGAIGFGVYRLVHLASRYTTVYQYRFSYQGRYSHFYYPENKTFGVVHHDDLLYLIFNPFEAPLFTRDDPEHVTVERLTRMWTAFAETGDPNKPNDEYLKGLKWRPFSFRKEPYLDIGNELVMKEGLYTDRFSVWKRLFPLNWLRRRNRLTTRIDTDDINEDYPIVDDEDAMSAL